MKTLKIKSQIFALILGLTIAFTGSAFTAKRAIQTWHLKSGQTISDVRNVSAYEMSTGSESCNGIATLPCKIQFDESESADLETYLSQFNSDSEVVSAAVSRRSN